MSVPAPRTAPGDNLDRLLTGVRELGKKTVHALAGDSSGCGALRGVDRCQLVFTTRPVTGRAKGCADDG